MIQTQWEEVHNEVHFWVEYGENWTGFSLIFPQHLRFSRSSEKKLQEKIVK